MTMSIESVIRLTRYTPAMKLVCTKRRWPSWRAAHRLVAREGALSEAGAASDESLSHLLTGEKLDSGAGRSACCRHCTSLSVLVVDDDDETVKLVSAVLRKFGLRPRACTSAQEGVAALQASWPDVLISDLNMPGEDGYSLNDRERSSRASTCLSINRFIR